MHGKVDLGELRRRLVLLVAVERDPRHRVFALAFDEMARLHEHSARAAGGIKHHTVIWLDHVHDHLYERGRGEELAVVVGLLLRELHEEVLVDATEDIAGG